MVVWLVPLLKATVTLKFLLEVIFAGHLSGFFFFFLHCQISHVEYPCSAVIMLLKSKWKLAKGWNMHEKKKLIKEECSFCLYVMGSVLPLLMKNHPMRDHSPFSDRSHRVQFKFKGIRPHETLYSINISIWLDMLGLYWFGLTSLVCTDLGWHVWFVLIWIYMFGMSGLVLLICVLTFGLYWFGLTSLGGTDLGWLVWFVLIWIYMFGMSSLVLLIFVLTFGLYWFGLTSLVCTDLDLHVWDVKFGFIDLCWRLVCTDLSWHVWFVQIWVDTFSLNWSNMLSSF